MGYSLGIGLTSDCNLACAHCYRPTDHVYALTPADVAAVCDRLDISSAGLGTGENALHPDFLPIVADLHRRGVRLSIASNGYSLNTMPIEHLRLFSDVEVSIDLPTEAEHDAFRGPGNWREVHLALERCAAEGVTASILATIMNANCARMPELAALARSLGVNLRVNVYQPVQNDRFALTYDQFWGAFRDLFASSRLLSCTEPVVRAVLGLGAVQSPCGHESIRLTPQGVIAPCVYWPASSLRLDDLVRLGEDILQTDEFQQARAVPAAAASCACQGGCASRRALLGQLDAHDRYCPWVRGETIDLPVTWAPPQELVRARNYCTTIVN